MSVTKAVILARGLGSRMRQAAPGADLSQAQAAAADAGVKGMINVGRPFLDYVISALADAGITDVCLVIGPEHDVIREHYGKLNTTRVRIHFAIQEKPLGTANAVAAAKEFAGADRFVVLNSDNYYPPRALGKLTQVSGAATLGFARQALIDQSNIPAERIAAFAIMLPQTGSDGASKSEVAASESAPENSAVTSTEATQWLETMVEKPAAELLAAHPDAPISMNAWVFTPEIFPAIEQIDLSERGEYEIADAVRAFLANGNKLQIIPVAAGVLDMSRRDDIAAVAAALHDVEVTL